MVFIAILHAHLQNDTRGITVLLLLCVDDMVNKQAKCYKFLVLSRLTQLGLTAL